MDVQNDKISQLIARQVLGCSTAQEQEELNVWLDGSPDHRSLYVSIKKASNKSKREEYINGINTQEAWRKISQQLDLPPKRKKIKMSWYKSLAAILVIGLLTGYFIHSYQSSLTDHPLVASIAEPGTSQATLVLHDGQIIDLEQGQLDRVIGVNGIRISINDGQVSYVDHTARITDVQLALNRITVPKGGEYQLVLSDSTRVWLNADSELTYPVSFSGDERRLSLKGEACFEVTPNQKKPFIVTVGAVDVRVLGTVFNIEAYPENDNVITTLVEGAVELNKGDKSQLLTLDEQAVIGVGDERFVVNSVNAKNYVLWKEGVFFFEDETLESILQKLTRWYNVEIEFENPALRETRFSMEVKKYEELNKVLTILEHTRRVRFDWKDDKIMVN